MFQRRGAEDAEGEDNEKRRDWLELVDDPFDAVLEMDDIEIDEQSERHPLSRR